jgi:hypothetical protein
MPESERKFLNKRQTELRELLQDPEQFDKAIELFFIQHALLHSADIARPARWSYEDEIFTGIDEQEIRRIPASGVHSIAWLIWHLARIEDVAMNLLVAGSPQVFSGNHWLVRMNLSRRDTGNAMAAEDIARLSETIEVGELRVYRSSVGQRTREIVGNLRPEDLYSKVDPARLQGVAAEGAVVSEAGDLLDYWSKRRVAGLLLMPATRHNIVHLNEAYRIRQQLEHMKGDRR